MKYKIGILCIGLIGLSLVIAFKLHSHDAWREIVLSDNGKPIPTLKAIAIPATVECNGKKMKAYVVLEGHSKPDGLGYPSLSVVVQNIKDVVPSSELEQFEGPDLSDAAIKERALEINIVSNKMSRIINTRMIFAQEPDLPADVLGDEDNIIDMGVFPTKQDKMAWKQLIVEMSSGFDKGHLTIGGPIFSHKLNVEFSGKGIESPLKKLLEFTGP